MSTRKLLFVFAVFVLSNQFVLAQSERTEKIQTLFDTLVAYEIEAPKTVAAIAILETGWLECKKCAYKYNNLFGFRGHGPYMKFDDHSECIAYLKNWQEENYMPWKEKHPRSTYHQFLTHIKYAEDMPLYLQHIRQLEKWVTKNVTTQSE